jgi:NAD(P)H-hydrate epimerase
MSETLGLPTPQLPRLPRRAVDSHKGNFGHALVLGGSRGMAGSISLTAGAALHAGAGLVTQAVPDRILETVAAFNPCAMTVPLCNDADGRIAGAAYDQIAERFSRTTCIACGPGLGRSPELQALISRLMTEAPIPCVLDADGLNNMADSGGWPKSCRAPRILTPHPGEWSRLCGVAASETRSQQAAAIDFAKTHRVIVVLKGHRTLVTDGDSAYLNDTGTPAMASGGSGDVLTGVIAALVCQGLSPRDAAHLGVYAHGLAGELAEQSRKSRVVVASQLVEFLDAALSSALA